jgi:DHA1 family bicyclomycin/chloramphenicol resistance-like MFS transporter
LVRDLFTQERAVRIMNLIGIILAVGPAIAPTLGGLTMEFFGWHAIFLLMVLLGTAVVLVTIFAMRETVVRDLSRIRPAALMRSYGRLLATPYFMLACVVVAGTSGALYAQATVLPFILMDQVGLTPSQFGLGMLMQTGSFFSGSFAGRMLLDRFGAARLVLPGLFCVALGSLGTAIMLGFFAPTFLSVMIPVGLYAFGIALVMPAMMTAAMAPFPHSAGAASALMGFMQMGAGLLGGSVAALIGAPAFAMATVIPVMGSCAILAWVVWRNMPEPNILVIDRHG